jgi:hypothetical protein
MGKGLFASGRFWNGPLVVTAHVPAPELQEQRVALHSYHQRHSNPAYVPLVPLDRRSHR